MHGGELWDPEAEVWRTTALRHVEPNLTDAGFGLNLHTLSETKPILYTLKHLRLLLTDKQRRRSNLILAIATLISLADVLGLSAMVPVLMLAIDKSFLEKSSKIRWIYEHLNFESEAHFLIFLIALILIFFLLKNLLAILFYRYTRRNALSIVSSLASRCYQHHFRAGSELSFEHHAAQLSDKVLFTPFHFVTGVYFPVINLISELVVVGSLLLVFGIYKPMLLLFLCGLFIPSFYLINRYTRNRVFNLGKTSSHYRQKATHILDFGLPGYIDIRIHKAEQRFFEKFQLYQEGFTSAGIRTVSFQLIPGRINEIVALTGIILLVFYGYFISDNPGDVRVTAALLAFSIFRMIPAANRVLQANLHIKAHHFSITRLLECQTNEGEQDLSGPVDFEEHIALKGLSFSYNKSAHKVFDEVNLEIPRGICLGIIGASGSGKSTLLKLIMGMEHPQSGEILCDGVPMDAGQNLSGLCGYVSQEPFLFQGTLAENVALGQTPGTIDLPRVIESLKQAAFIPSGAESEWPFQTIEDRGNNLSEGQKQRISLARALYFDRPLLILDEPTSALDEETEAQVVHTIQNLRKSGKTIIIIAHRGRMLDLCDKTYQIKNQKLHQS